MNITTFLSFVGDQCGKAEEAINFYTSIFPNAEIKSIKKSIHLTGNIEINNFQQIFISIFTCDIHVDQ